MSDNVPGFSAEQTWALRRLIREEVHEGIKLALTDPNCPRNKWRRCDCSVSAGARH